MKIHWAVAALVALAAAIFGFGAGANLEHAAASARDFQEQAEMRQLAADRARLMAELDQVTVLYEPCSIEVADGLAAIQPGALLTAAGVPQCAAWAIHGADVRRWGAQQGGLVLRADAHGHPLGQAQPAARMPGYQP